MRGRAGLAATRSAAVLLGAVFAFGMLDFWRRLERSDRFVTWALRVALAVTKVERRKDGGRNKAAQASQQDRADTRKLDPNHSG